MAIKRRYIDAIALTSQPQTNSYLHTLPAVQYLQREQSLSFNSDITFFVGENGTGKSTLIEAIAIAFGFNPEGGSRNFSFSTKASHAGLWKHLNVLRTDYPKDGFFLRAESFYNVASYIEALDEIPAAAPPIIEGYGGISLHEQSHGESFMALVQNRFQGNGLYILDEPEAALSPAKLLTLLAEIHALVKKKSQFIIATHSPILMAYPGAQILEFSDIGIEQVNYHDTEHYQISRNFLDNPEKMLNILLKEEELS